MSPTYVLHTSTLTIFAGIDYFHQCRDAAQASRSVDEQTVLDDIGTLMADSTLCGAVHDDTVLTSASEPVMTVNQIEEDWHGRLAVEMARYVGHLSHDSGAWYVTGQESITVADSASFSQLLLWRKLLQNDAVKRHSVDERDTCVRTESDTFPTAKHPPSVTPLIDLVTNDPYCDAGPQGDNPDNSSSVMEDGAANVQINEEQQHACNLIISHLEDTLAGREPKPLRMVVYGEGGTGQSHSWETSKDTDSLK